MKSEPNYARLSDADADGFPVEKALLQHDSQERQLSKRQTSTPFLLHAGIILLEVVFGGLIIAGLISIHNARLSITAGSALNGLPQLNSYNTTMRFHNNSELLNDSKDADAYWQDLLQSGGVVSLNTEWAREQGLRPSAMSPTDSTQSIYQVDTFHALHCLVRLFVAITSWQIGSNVARMPFAKIWSPKLLRRGTRSTCSIAWTTSGINCSATPTSL